MQINNNHKLTQKMQNMNISSTENYNETAGQELLKLVQTIKHDDPSSIEQLLRGNEHGAADPNIKSKAGLTPLYYAILLRLPEIIKILLQYGAYPHFKTQENRTPLHWAIYTNNPEIIDLLINFMENPHPFIQNLSWEKQFQCLSSIDQLFKKRVIMFLLCLKRLQATGTLKVPKPIREMILQFLYSCARNHQIVVDWILTADNQGLTAVDIAINDPHCCEEIKKRLKGYKKTKD